MAEDKLKNIKSDDNSYMFVDEDKEDISKASMKTKGRYLDETISGDIVDESTINLVADEDVSKEIASGFPTGTKGQLSFQEKLEKRAQDFTQSIDDTIERSREEISKQEKSSVALGNERINTKGKGFGVASLVCGVISLTFFCSFINIFTSVLSLAFGVVQLRRGAARGIAIAGIVCSILSVILLVVCMNLLTSNQAFIDMLSNTILGMGLIT